MAARMAPGPGVPVGQAFGIPIRFHWSWLLLFALAWLIALVLQPIIAWMTRVTLPVPLVSRRAADSGIISSGWRLPRALAVLLVYLALLAVVVFLVISLVPVIGPHSRHVG